MINMLAGMSVADTASLLRPRPHELKTRYQSILMKTIYAEMSRF